MNRLGFILLAFGLSVPAYAADAPKASLLGNHNASQPVNIEADKMQADLNAKIVTYSGAVIATQGDIKLRADTMKYDDPNNKLYASGKVVVDSPAGGTATGDNGIYDSLKKLITLSGHVVLNKPGQATMRGSLLTVNMVTGVATATARPVTATPDQAAAQGLPGGRVQGVFTPKSAPVSKAPNGN